MSTSELGGIRPHDWRRLYARAHPLALVLSGGLAATGLLLLLSPPLFADTVISQALPAGLEYPWNVALVAGGILVLLGFWLLDNRLEAAGSALLAGCLLIWVIVYIEETPTDLPVYGVVPLSVGFFAAIGYAVRCVLLTMADDGRPWWPRR